MVLGVLSDNNVDRVKHKVEAESDENSYQNRKDGLVASHVMSDYEKIDKLVSMERLNGSNTEGRKSHATVPLSNNPSYK
jgi:hypothetical protein